MDKELRRFIFNIANINLDIDSERDSIEIKALCLKTIREKSIIITHPKVANEWHPYKNKTLIPENFTYGSQTKVWWLGKCGHEWKDTIHHRTSGIGCPICRGSQVLKGYNDFATKCPTLVKFWDENNVISPSEVTSKSHKKIKCKCPDCNYKWNTDVSKLTVKKGCPCCLGTKIIPKKNDILGLFPELFNNASNIQWDYERNNKENIFPEGLGKSSLQKAHWLYNGQSKKLTVKQTIRN